LTSLHKNGCSPKHGNHSSPQIVIITKYCLQCLVVSQSFIIFANMKRHLSVILTGLAILLTMIAVGIHHHHKGEMMYIVLNECTNGQNNGQPSQDECPETVDHSLHYLAASFVEIVNNQNSQSNWHPWHFLPSLLATGPSFLIIPYSTSNNRCAFAATTPFHLSWIAQSLGFRAPPALA